MNTNKEQQEKESPSQNPENNLSPNSGKAAENAEHKDKGEETFMGEVLENPAEQSEVGGEIYDIGMGGPGASSSGLRDRNTNDEDE